LRKIKGCRVIGIAGTKEKCDYLKSLGFDVALNYKENFVENLKKETPDGIDCFFDNVGGEILDAVLLNLRVNARIAICGQISEYNRLGEPSVGPRLFFHLIYKNAKIEGFVSTKWVQEWPQGIKEMAEWISQKKIKYDETIEEGGIEATPKAFISMLSGGNVGKQLVKL